jgi:chromosome segregation ATPase
VCGKQQINELLDQAIKLGGDIQQHGCVTGTDVWALRSSVSSVINGLVSMASSIPTPMPASLLSASSSSLGESAEADTRLQQLRLQYHGLNACFTASRATGTEQAAPSVAELMQHVTALRAQLEQEQLQNICMVSVSAAVCTANAELLDKAMHLEGCLGQVRRGRRQLQLDLDQSRREVAQTRRELHQTWREGVLVKRDMRKLDKKYAKQAYELAAADARASFYRGKANVLQGRLDAAHLEMEEAAELAVEQQQQQQQQQAADQAAAAHAAGPIVLQLVVQEVQKAPAATAGAIQAVGAVQVCAVRLRDCFMNMLSCRP